VQHLSHRGVPCGCALLRQSQKLPPLHQIQSDGAQEVEDGPIWYKGNREARGLRFEHANAKSQAFFSVSPPAPMIENLTIPRVLNLSDTADRCLLKEAAERSPALLALINRYLDDYLRLFPEAHFQKIYSGGIIGVTSKSNATAGSDILRMLQLTERLVALEKYQGFPCLLNGFRNPTQFESTRFEVAVASWCDSRRVTVSLAFSPTVSRKGRQKTPELLWETTLGDLYCECKREHLNAIPFNGA